MACAGRFSNAHSNIVAGSRSSHSYYFQTSLLSIEACNLSTGVHRYPRPNMSSGRLCCCGCGERPEIGRKAHICSDTKIELFAGFCQSSEDGGPCRRCIGNTDYQVRNVFMLLRLIEGICRSALDVASSFGGQKVMVLPSNAASVSKSEKLWASQQPKMMNLSLKHVAVSAACTSMTR